MRDDGGIACGGSALREIVAATPRAPPRAGLVRCVLPQRLLVVGGDKGVDQAEQLLLGLCWHALDEPEATFEPRADGRCGGLALGADAEQGL